MPGPYTPDPTNAAQPADNFIAGMGAAELRALKGYIQGLIGVTGTITLDVTALQAAVSALEASPLVGMVADFMATAAPTGWHILNGATLSRVTFAGLFAFAQTSGIYISDATWVGNPLLRGNFSNGDGATTFRIPDLRGTFGRSADLGAGVDPDNTPVGSYKADQLDAHTHPLKDLVGGNGGVGGGGSFFPRADSGPNTYNTGSTGGTETNPKMVARLTCIHL